MSMLLAPPPVDPETELDYVLGQCVGGSVHTPGLTRPPQEVQGQGAPQVEAGGGGVL